MDQPRLMHLLHGLNGRTENGFRLRPGHGAGALQPGFQGLALYEVHDDVGGFILPEQLPNLDHPGDVLYLGHFPGFLQEHLEPILLGQPGLLGFRPDQPPGARQPADLAGGVVLLNGNLSFQGNVPADVGNAEAALAQHLTHQVLSAKNRLRRQGKGVFLHLPDIEAAFRAGIPPKILHAA